MISFIIKALFYPVIRFTVVYLFLGYTEMTLLALKKHKERFIIVSIAWTIAVLILRFVLTMGNPSIMMSALGIATGILFYNVFPFKIQKIVRWIHRNKKK